MRRKRFEFIASVWHVVTGRCPFHPLLPRCLVQYCLCYSPFKRVRNDTRAYGSYDPRSKPRFLSFARTRLRKKVVYALLESVKRRRVYRNGDRLTNVSDLSRFDFTVATKYRSAAIALYHPLPRVPLYLCSYDTLFAKSFIVPLPSCDTFERYETRAEARTDTNVRIRCERT